MSLGCPQNLCATACPAEGGQSHGLLQASLQFPRERAGACSSTRDDPTQRLQVDTMATAHWNQERADQRACRRGLTHPWIPAGRKVIRHPRDQRSEARTHVFPWLQVPQATRPLHTLRSIFTGAEVAATGETTQFYSRTESLDGATY